MKLVVRYSVRLGVMLAVIAATLFLPQQIVYGLPQTRTHDVGTVQSGVPVNLPFPATDVIVGWTGERENSVQVRGANKDGVWSEWKTVNDDDFSDEHEIMVQFDDVVTVEVRTIGNASDLNIFAIDAENGPRTVKLESSARAAAIDGHTGQPPIITRAQWGADESWRKNNQTYAPVTGIVVHHTVTQNNDSNPSARIRAIYASHTQSQGWDDIGYNFLIDQQGRIYEGRWARNYGPGEYPTGENISGNLVTGAHALGHNVGKVGIALLGTFNDVAPPAAQQRALEQLIAWEGDRHNLDLLAPGIVVGHRNVYATACPGNVAYGLLPSWVQQANVLKALAYPPGNTPGYWVAARDGGVLAFGDAQFYGSMAGRPLNGPIASMIRTSSGRGYWLMGTDGGIFSFGDAQFYGSMGGQRLNQPVVGLAPTPTGQGYWLVASDGGIFAFGDAGFYGSMGGQRLNKPVVGMTATPSGKGYYLVASDGGIFSFGDAQFYGSTGSMKLAQPVMTMSVMPDGTGYWLFARDGGVFAFGSAPFRGSIPMLRLTSFAGAVNSVSTETGNGYYLLAADGGVYGFGDARYWGSMPASAVGMALVPES